MPIKQTPTVSIDIGHSNLKIIQTAPDGKIAKFVVHKMPEGCVEDLNILSDDALVKALKLARKKARLSTGKCSLVLSGGDIIIRHFTLPILPEEEMYQNIINEMSGYLPVDPEKYCIDYKIVDTIQDDGIDMYKVLVTSAHKRIINRYKKVLHMAGFDVKIIDTCENAKEKLIMYNHSLTEKFPTEGGVCIIDFGTMHTRVNLYHNGLYYVNNVIKRCGQTITNVISQSSGRDILTSETMKREIDFLNGTYKNAEVKSAVTYEVDSMLYEMSRVFDYFKNRTKSSVNCIFISGGGSLLPGLREYMERHLNIPVHHASDLLAVSKKNKDVDARGFAFLLNAYSATFREGLQ